MKRYIFLTILAFLTSGCIPKYVDQNPSQTAKVSPQPRIQTPQVVQNQAPVATTVQPVVEEEVIEEQKNSKSYKVTMKTKKFAFSDTGFLVKYANSLNLNVLAMGKSVLDLKVKQNEDDVCVGSLCNTKHGFNQSFLDGRYPDSFIQNILLKKPIFGGRGLKKTSKGFVQNIICDRFGIKYQVSNKSLYFKDKKNNILIKLKEIR